MWNTVRAILLDKRLVSVGCLLLVLVFVDSRLPCGVHPIVSELDILEHFLFGFVLSDFASKVVNSMIVTDEVREKLQRRQVDLLIRFSGFFVIGVILWELSELFIFPLLLGSVPNPFFSFPITLTNIDGAIDVTIGAIGCIIAWHLAK